jgi:hypothetical protein
LGVVLVLLTRKRKRKNVIDMHEPVNATDNK